MLLLIKNNTCNKIPLQNNKKKYALMHVKPLHNKTFSKFATKQRKFQSRYIYRHINIYNKIKTLIYLYMYI